jgi:metal-dependent hydrolase (beta-lactamase superfamily II)
MDTSGSFDALFNNASKLNVNLSRVEAIFISHWHVDHRGSLSHVLPLLSKSTPTYVPSKDSSGARAKNKHKYASCKGKQESVELQHKCPAESFSYFNCICDKLTSIIKKTGT